MQFQELIEEEKKEAQDEPTDEQMVDDFMEFQNSLDQEMINEGIYFHYMI